MMCLALASMLMSWITAGDASKRKRRVILGRKYFHLVAIILFAPITWLDPDMMALSYAIAVALLIVMEMVRVWFFTDNTDGTAKSSWNQFYMVFLDEKDSSAAKGGLAITHTALIVGLPSQCG